ncbi:hypothetical protein HK104_004042 [Borealophlyctis nickersoniae]|nr:hypothetical protein HK104_004042 [Borealophlyctis nickersoniae]
MMSFPTVSGLTFEETVQVMMRNKMDQARAGESRNFEVCTSHDLAPLVKEVFGIPKGFQEEKVFVAGLKAFNKTWKKQKKQKKQGK